MKEAQLIRYTRNRKGNRNGCLVAAKIGNQVHIGYSKCHNADDFDKHIARKMATGRMNNKKKDYTQEIPASMFDEFKHFTDRCVKYFKV